VNNSLDWILISPSKSAHLFIIKNSLNNESNNENQL